MTALTLAACQSVPATCPALVEGVVWQPSRASASTVTEGRWDLLGAQRLMLQWVEVDGTSFLPGEPSTGARTAPDWGRLGRLPWARQVTMGLAGLHDEATARRSVPQLAARSQALAAAVARQADAGTLPLHITGWYFPVEVDPTWVDATALRTALAPLPRPLWISAYDSANAGPVAMADWIERWLPPDVGILFQDGVGVHARTPQVARAYVQALAERLGRHRVQLIAEAFRPAPEGGFRAATAAELLPQLQTYAGWPVLLFDGPHYVSNALVDALVALDGASQCRRAPVR